MPTRHGEEVEGTPLALPEQPLRYPQLLPKDTEAVGGVKE